MSATATAVSQSTSSAANPVNSSSASATTTSTTSTSSATLTGTAPVNPTASLNTTAASATSTTATATAPSIPKDLKPKLAAILEVLECQASDYQKCAYENIESALLQAFDGKDACERTQSQIDYLIKGLGNTNPKELKDALVSLYTQAKDYGGEMSTVFKSLIGISHGVGDTLIEGRNILDDLSVIYDSIDPTVNVGLQNASAKTDLNKTTAVKHSVQHGKAAALKSSPDRKTVSELDKSKTVKTAMMSPVDLRKEIQSAVAFANEAHSECSGVISNIQIAQKQAAKGLLATTKAGILLRELLLLGTSNAGQFYTQLKKIKDRLDKFNDSFKKAIDTTAQMSLSAGASLMRGYNIKTVLQTLDQPDNIGVDTNPSNGANALLLSKDGSSAAAAKSSGGGAGPSNPNGDPEPPKSSWPCNIS